MSLTRRIILSLALMAGLVPAVSFAQAPPPVPALPDTERRTSYSISGTTCACAVNFAIFGDSTDYQDWVEVFLNGNPVAYNDPTLGWNITNPTGQLSTIPRPITDAVLTFNSAQTGTVQIVGARRPRRVSQFAENRGVAARDLNQAITDIIAQNRETWDKINDVTGRVPLARPGETLALLPILANRQNMGACFDSGGNLNSCVSIPSSTFTAGSGITFTGVGPTTIAVDPTVVPKLAGTNTFTGNNTHSGTETFTGDGLFASGRPWCDVRVGKPGGTHQAKGDGSTDDSAAFQDCIDYLNVTYGGGRVYVPPSNSVYCLTTGVHVNTGNTSTGSIIIEGGAGPISGTAVAACGNNTAPLFNLNNQWVQLLNMSVYGFGALENPFASSLPTQAAVLVNSSCSQCTLRNLYITGGADGLQIQASGYVVDNVWVSFSYSGGANAKGMVYTINGGGTIRDSHIDMVWPLGAPAHGTGISGWAATHAYTTGTVVSVTCLGRSWWIQAANNGTSGGSQPACNRFGVYGQDNVTGSCPSPSAGVCWLLVNATDSYCLQYDTGTIEPNLITTDMTCAANYNLGITNTFAGTAPTQIHINPGNTPGGAVSGNVRINQGNNITIMGLETSFCLAAGCAGVVIDNAVSLVIDIIGIHCLNFFSYCVNVTAASSHITVAEMRSTGADTADFNVSAAATSFKLVDSTHLSGAGNLFTIAAVAADHYIVANNICNGAASSDGGTGTHKSVTACSGAGP